MAHAYGAKVSLLYNEDSFWNEGLQKYMDRGFFVVIALVLREADLETPDLDLPGQIHWCHRKSDTCVASSGGPGRWAAVVCETETDARAARRALLLRYGGGGITHCTLCVPGEGPRQARACVVVPKTYTRSCVAVAINDSLASVETGPCVHADILHDVLVFDTKAAADQAVSDVTAALEFETDRPEVKTYAAWTSDKVHVHCNRAAGQSETAVELTRLGVDPRAIPSLISAKEFRSNFTPPTVTLSWPTTLCALATVEWTWKDGPVQVLCV
jgi:hypothetical protein